MHETWIWFFTNHNFRSRHGSGTMSPQSRLQSSGSATPRSRHQSEEASRGTWHQNGWHQNEELTSSRSRHRSEEWEQNPPVRGQEILQVDRSLQINNTHCCRNSKSDLIGWSGEGGGEAAGGREGTAGGLQLPPARMQPRVSKVRFEWDERPFYSLTIIFPGRWGLSCTLQWLTSVRSMWRKCKVFSSISWTHLTLRLWRRGKAQTPLQLWCQAPRKGATTPTPSTLTTSSASLTKLQRTSACETFQNICCCPILCVE